MVITLNAIIDVIAKVVPRLRFTRSSQSNANFFLRLNRRKI